MVPEPEREAAMVEIGGWLVKYEQLGTALLQGDRAGVNPATTVQEQLALPERDRQQGEAAFGVANRTTKGLEH